MDKSVPPSRVSGIIKAPSSKSYAQRAIAAALLAEGKTTIKNLEICNDTAAAIRVIEMLGATVERVGNSTYIVNGGLRPASTVLNVGESGLSARMFIPIASLCDVPVTISGEGSLEKRPFGMVARPLSQLGVDVTTQSGHLPVTVKGPLRGGRATVDGSLSSQFLTGLLMALPLVKSDTILQASSLNSVPYIKMTLDVLDSFGIEVKHNNLSEFYIEGGQSYSPFEYNIEGDWSGASCILVAGAVAGGEVTVININPLSKQADVAIVEALSRAGAGITTTSNTITVSKPERLRAFEFDATHCPDLFPALVALAANCEGESVIKGTDRLLHKESDRAAALVEEFTKMGIVLDTGEDDTMKITGGRIRATAIDSHNDHRIAMSAAAAALNGDGIMTISGAECVNKSYPAFWDDLGQITVK